MEAALTLEHPVLPEAFWRESLSAGWGYWERGGCPLPSLNPRGHSSALDLVWCLGVQDLAWGDVQLNNAIFPHANLPGLSGNFASARLDPTNGKD